MVCGCVLHRGQRGEGWCVSSTLCRYDIRMGRNKQKTSKTKHRDKNSSTQRKRHKEHRGRT